MTDHGPAHEPPAADPFAHGLWSGRLAQLAAARLEAGEDLVCWTRAWVSADGPLNTLLAARTRDYAVLTTRRLMLWSTGFLTRRPLRRVLADRLDSVVVQRLPSARGIRLRVSGLGHRPLRLDLGSSRHGARFSHELTARARAERADSDDSGDSDGAGGGR